MLTPLHVYGRSYATVAGLVTVRETTWLVKSKIFTLWSFRGDIF